MSSNHIDLVSILLNTLLVSCFVLAGAKSNSKTQSCPVKKGELGRNPKLSSPEECARVCKIGDPPKICYYHFVLEPYNVNGRACEVCTPNATNALKENCQCVLADGVEKTILTVNRMIPGPSIEVCQGDKVVIDVENRMEGIETTIHWHGVFQKGYQYYDGVPFVTQCPIPEGTTFRYQWLAENAGTHFWHSHSGLQKLDGISGGLIIRQPHCKDPNGYLYDEYSPEHVIFCQDWMHELASEHFPGRLETKRGQTPDSILINGKGQHTNQKTGFRTNTSLEVFTIKPGHRHLFRMIDSFCTVCPLQLSIQGHAMTVVSTDGEPIQPVTVNTIIAFAGERYNFVLNATAKPGKYWIQVRGLGECGVRRIQQLAILQYEGTGPHDELSPEPTYDQGLPNGVILNPLDAICDRPRKNAKCISQLKHAKPDDQAMLKRQPDVKIYLPFKFDAFTPEEIFQPKTYHTHLIAPTGDPVIAYVDGISFKSPPSPLISQSKDIPKGEICNKKKKPANCGKFCSCTHVINVPYNSTCELIFFDQIPLENLSHPFHLHGYAFRVLGMGRFLDKNVTNITSRYVRHLDEKGLLNRNWKMPPAKDTIAVPNNGYVILKFHADNPGYWLVHCHFLFHIGPGMVVVIHVGTDKDLPKVPPGFPVCGNHLPPIEDSFNCSKATSHNAWKPNSEKYLDGI